MHTITHTKFFLTALLLSGIGCKASFMSGQPPKEYYAFTKKADSLYKAKDYRKSALAYSSAFAAFGGKGVNNDRYSAARSWAMAKVADSAFFQLYRITQRAMYSDDKRVAADTAFKSLHSDKRWESLLGLMKANRAFNFGFERIRVLEEIPQPWFQWGTKDYILRADSTERHSGRYSLLIEPLDELTEKSFGCVARAIPAIYSGKEIEVKAWIKMENVDKPIGLLLRIDGEEVQKSLAFDNMQQKKIRGTKDWTLYSVKLTLPKDASKIYIGAILSGTGKLWADDFQVFVDDKNINDIADR